MRKLVPDFVLHNFGQRRFDGQFQAVCLFVDTSGFTPLTNNLMAQGTEGTEVIAEVLTGVFTPLVQIVYEQGGFIAGFAGDAFKAIFPLIPEVITETNAEEAEAPATTRAYRAYERSVAAAWQIKERMAQQPTFTTRFGLFDFAVKVTIAGGSVDWGIWRGDVERAAQNAVYFFEGAALARCLAADPFAAAGEVIITQAVYEQLPARAVTVSAVPPYQCLTGVNQVLLDACPPLAMPETTADETLSSAFFPIELLHMPARGEFRQVVALFINLQSMPMAETFSRTLFRLLNQYGGYVCRAGRISDRDQGGTLLLFWGAPHSTENDVARALLFILELQKAVATPLKAGLTSNLAYAGFIGSARREEYTCHGTYVNLAARQMVAAPWDEIWLDEEAARQAETAFDLIARGERRFKGFAEKRSVFLLKGRRQAVNDSFYRGRMVGREHELAQLQEAVQPLLEGRFGGLLTVSGEAGTGKSRLVHEFLETSEVLKTSEVVLCQTDEVLRQSLNPFRYFLRHYFDQSPGGAEASNKGHFKRILDGLISNTAEAELGAELQRTRSFLGALLGLHWPDSLYAQLEPQLRFENTLAALTALIKAASLRRPLLIHLEDAHWLDDDSRACLSRLTRSAAGYPMLVIATTRPPQTDGGEAAPLVPEEVPQRAIRLTPLPPAAMEALAAAHLNGPPAPELVDLLAERAGGNPFFAEQILLYLQEEALIRRNGRGWELKNGAWPELSLPADVRSVLVARLDRLPPDVRRVVQTAAILGREFVIRVLAQMLSQEPAVMDKVAAAESAAVWTALSEARYLFRHVLLRDAAYEMQLQARRRRLHQLAAAAIETLYAAHLAPYYGELAYHYEQAGAVARARNYLQKAGDVAREGYQNSQAIDYYSRALALTTNAADKYHLLLAREKVYDLQGAREAQGQDLAALESLAETLADERRQAEVNLRRSHYARATGNYLAARAAARTAVRLAQASQADDLEAAGYEEWGRVILGRENLEAIRSRLERALTLAQAAGLRQVEANSLRSLGTAYFRHGDPSRGRVCFEQALRIYREVGDREGEANMLSNFGLIAADYDGDYTGARTYYEQALRIDHEMGNRTGKSSTLINLGEVSNAQGDYSGARDYFEQALRICRQTSERAGESMALINLGRVFCTQGDYSGAGLYYEQALRIYRQTGARGNESMALYYLGVVCGKQRDFVRARAYHEQSLNICREVGDRVSEGRALTGLGEALLGLGHLAQAATAFQQAVVLRQELDQQHLVVESQAGLARAALAQGDLTQAQAQIETILDYLEANTLDGAEEPFRVYLTCYRVLRATQDARAQDILKAAHNLLQAQAAKIDDEEMRRSFLENVSAHRQIGREFARLINSAIIYSDAGST